MKNWKHYIISFIGLLLLHIFVATTIHAEEDLNQLHQELQRDYSKNNGSKLHLSKAFQNNTSINERQIIVKTDPDAEFEASSYDVRLKEGSDRLKRNGILVVQVLENTDYKKTLNEIKKDNGVLHAEPDFLIEKNNKVKHPNDPLFKQQWYLNTIDLMKAWGVTQGSKDVTIGIIDSGVDGNHPDLKNRILRGYDFVKYIQGGNKDAEGHGTHVAGIIGANSNQIGVVGIDQEATILPIRAMDETGNGSVSSEIDSIYYAIEQDVDVLNMSYVVGEKNNLEKEALWKAYDAGIVLVAAAGNYSSKERMYPGSYPHVINVSSTTKKDKLAGFSNYGNGIDLSAPGEKIYSTAKGDSYSSEDGTSFSAPIVSAIAGLVIAEHPDWGPDKIRYVIENSAKNVRGLEWDHQFGYGRVNAYQALESQAPVSSENNHSESAEPIDVGKRKKGRLLLPLDTNWYSFSIPEKTEVTIDLTNESIQSDLIGMLYKEEDNNFNQVQILDDTAMGDDEEFADELEAGKYYFAVSEIHGRWSKDPYFIQIHHEQKEIEERLYSDVSFYQDEIQYLSKAGIIKGYPDGRFRPQDNVRRIQALKMILHEKGINVKSYHAPDPKFKDIKPGFEGYKEVAAAVELGIIKGRQDNTFGPWEGLTRAQMSAMMTKAYGFKGTSKVMFTDVSTSHWAYKPVQALVTNGIVKGFPDNTFRPYEALTRQHFSVMMYKIINER